MATRADIEINVKGLKKVQELSKLLDKLVEHLRIDAVSEVILANGRTFATILKQSSQGADFIFLGMPSPHDEQLFVPNYERLQQWTQDLPTTVFVLAAPEFNFQEILGEN